MTLEVPQDPLGEPATGNVKWVSTNSALPIEVLGRSPGVDIADPEGSLLAADMKPVSLVSLVRRVRARGVII